VAKKYENGYWNLECKYFSNLLFVILHAWFTLRLTQCCSKTCSEKLKRFSPSSKLHVNIRWLWKCIYASSVFHLQDCHLLHFRHTHTHTPANCFCFFFYWLNFRIIFWDDWIFRVVKQHASKTKYVWFGPVHHHKTVVFGNLEFLICTCYLVLHYISSFKTAVICENLQPNKYFSFF